jgi:hypothetical protein
MSDENKIEELKPGKSPRDVILARIKEDRKKAKTEELRKAMGELLAADEVRAKALNRVLEIEGEINEISNLSVDF